MLTDGELTTLMEDQEVLDAIMTLKSQFIKSESQFLEMTDDDFISLVLLAPSVGVALANGTISLFEELTLNKKARKLSRSSYFLRKDPIVHALQFLVKNFSKWENDFYKLIKLVLFSTFKDCPKFLEAVRNPENTTHDLAKDVLNTPYVLVKIISFLFTEEEEDLLNQRSISKIEYNKILEIGQKLDLDKLPIFQMFSKSFVIR